MTGPYQSLNLDEILEITGSDARHAPQLRLQGRGLKALADILDSSVGAMLSARATAESGFEGVSASSLHGRATELVDRGSEGHAAIRDQHRIFFALSDQAELTHQRMRELRDERDAKLARAAPGDRTAIREDYTFQAREYMRQTTAGYVATLRRSDWIKGYEGPRLPRDGEGAGPKGFRDLTTVGPSLGHGEGPQLQSAVGGATLSPELGNGGAGPGQSVLRTQSWVGFGSVGFGPSANNNKNKNKKDRKTAGSDATDPQGLQPTEREILPPVIGRREPEMTAAEPGPAPRADGVTAPVIGARDTGQAPADSGQPQHRTDGLLPPVIGARPMAGGLAGPVTTPASIAAAPPVEATRRPGPQFGVTAAGVRTVEHHHHHSAEGRVFRGGGEPTAAPRGGDVDFTRQSPTPPDPIDPVAERRFHAFAAPADAPTVPTPAPPGGQRFRQEPEYETGPFLTIHNLGRKQ